MVETEMVTDVIRILLIEDNPGDTRLIKEMLSDSELFNCVLECTARLSAGLEHLAGQPADIVLLDLGLPDSQGLDTLAKVCAHVPGIPVLVLTGMDDEGLALEAVRQGAQDYLLKGAINGRALWRGMTYAIERNYLPVMKTYFMQRGHRPRHRWCKIGCQAVPAHNCALICRCAGHCSLESRRI